MTFKFVNQPLLSGLYEPEGIYLNSPLMGRFVISQQWGEFPDHYQQFTYNGVPLKGHIGLDFAAPVGTRVAAVAAGRVAELGYEDRGFGRYLKLEHSWGESFYAHLEEIWVDAGQLVARGATIALSGDRNGEITPHLHFGLRIKPFNRFDGWGGFTDPLPYLSASDFERPDVEDPEPPDQPPDQTIAPERPNMRRP